MSQDTPDKDDRARIRALARSFADDAVETLAEIMRNPDEKAQTRAFAANSMLDRAYGKPSSEVEIQNNAGPGDSVASKLARFLAGAPAAIQEAELVEDKALPAPEKEVDSTD